MEKYLLNSPQQPTEEQLSSAADMVIRQALLDYRKDKLRKEIDDSLATRNKDEFFRLTDELKNLM
ncbi:phosphoesterase [Bacillus sp. Y1]|jgi:uncharacterized protein YpiB (UPF0302 family)|uniref:IDEAL domain-containing protein n=1 Tax=Robertmurraya sp. TaxID=2837525 RepID=UPI000E6AE4A5|nr:IDEAL domain-containing protein [Bacillus sp. Y1]AYA76319.1 phosphoesterase [Bacillus sp. Y1]